MHKLRRTATTTVLKFNRLQLPFHYLGFDHIVPFNQSNYRFTMIKRTQIMKAKPSASFLFFFINREGKRRKCLTVTGL